MQESPEENRIIIVNGEKAPTSAPVICADDAALQFGHALFETLVAFNGHVFQQDRHLERLRDSAAFFGIDCPPNPELRSAFSEALIANRLASEQRVRLRITLAKNRNQKTTWIVEATPARQYAETATAILLPFARNERSALVGHKTINYGENVIAQRFVNDRHCDEGIFSNSQNLVCEGIWSNLFLKIDGSMVTPPLHAGCLPGITRELILSLARETGIAIREEDIPVENLDKVESAWATSTLRGMQRIVRIDERDLAEPESEEWKRLSAAYHERVQFSYANS